MREYMKEYRKKPEVKARRKELAKKYNAKAKENRRRYYAKPEVKVRHNIYQKKYLAKPENKLKRKKWAKKYYINNRDKILKRITLYQKTPKMTKTEKEKIRQKLIEEIYDEIIANINKKLMEDTK